MSERCHPDSMTYRLGLFHCPQNWRYFPVHFQMYWVGLGASVDGNPSLLAANRIATFARWCGSTAIPWIPWNYTYIQELEYRMSEALIGTFRDILSDLRRASRRVGKSKSQLHGKVSHSWFPCLVLCEAYLDIFDIAHPAQFWSFLRLQKGAQLNHLWTFWAPSTLLVVKCLRWRCPFMWQWTKYSAYGSHVSLRQVTTCRP